MVLAKPGHGRTLAVLGVVLQIVALVYLFDPSSGNASFLGTLAVSGPGDPSGLASGLIEMLEANAIGLGVGAVGLGLLCAALVPCRYRALWFFRFLVVHGGLLLPVFPVGTAVGTFFLIYCFKRRREFLPPAA